MYQTNILHPYFKSILILVAEFIIDLAKTNDTFDSFKKALAENDADFSVSYRK